MPVERSKFKDYTPLSSSSKGSNTSADQETLRPSGSQRDSPSEGLHGHANSFKDNEREIATNEVDSRELPSAKVQINDSVSIKTPDSTDRSFDQRTKKSKKSDKDTELLKQDRWLVRNGHFLTFIGLYLFSIMVLFRPYEIVPGLGFLSSTAFYLAIATILVYLPSQLATEGNITMLSTEVKAILALTVIALLTIPLAKDPVIAWESFNDPFIKAVVIFIVLVNVVRTRERLMRMLWLSFGVGIYLGFSALDLYMKGQFSVEEYRVAVDVGGMFGNPNEMAMHFVMMTPLAITLGIAAKGGKRMLYFGMATLFVAANMVTFSRGGFLGLLACCGVLAWKLGRKYRLNVTIVSVVVGMVAILAAPGNYGLRMLSIFVPGLDAFGSSDQRFDLLKLSLLVSARNPWGIGIGNFPIVGVRNLQSHNAFTQVSSELGILGLIAYLIFVLSPFRKLGAIERMLFDKNDHNWFYYFSIGLQASIVGYLVSSFFASVAYNWFIYYLIAFAVAFRRIYSIETGLNEEIKPPPILKRRSLSPT